MATRKQKHAAAMQKREEWLAGEKLLGKLFQEKGRQERESREMNKEFPRYA